MGPSSFAGHIVAWDFGGRESVAFEANMWLICVKVKGWFSKMRMLIGEVRPCASLEDMLYC